MKDVKSRLMSEEGNTVIEATFVVTICFIFLFSLLLSGFIFYQETLLQSVADDAASSIGRTYNFRVKDPIVGYVKEENMKRGIFESSYWLVSPSKKNAVTMKLERNSLNHVSYTGSQSYVIDGSIVRINASSDDSRDEQANMKALWLAQSKLNKNRLMQCNTGTQIITSKIYRSEMVSFQNEIEVTIEEKYTIPFIEYFMVGKMDDGYKISVSSRAICQDMGAFYSYVNFIRTYVDYLKSKTGISKGVESTMSIIKNGVKLIGDAMNGNFFGR